MDQSLNLRGKRCPSDVLSACESPDEIGPSFISTLWVKIIQNVLIFQTHYPYEGNNLKRFHF